MTEMMIRPALFEFPSPTPPIGTLLGLVNIHEGISWLEPQGLVESYNCLRLDSIASWPCPATTLAVPTIATTTTATTGGTLPAGTYRAKIAAVSPDGGETTPSAETSQVTTGSVSTVTWTWAVQPAGTSINIYVTSGATNTETLIATVPFGTNTYTLSAPFLTTGVSPSTNNDAVIRTTKTFSSPAWQDGIRFAVYGGVSCKAIGFDLSTAQAKSEAAFLAMESVGVERALMTQRFVAGSTWTAATDLTPVTGAVSPAVGLGLLEGDAGCKYAGAPIFHIPKAIASRLISPDGPVERVGDKLFTSLGGRVAAGAGYGCPNTSPTGAAPPTGELWMYVSGEVTVARSEVIVATQMDRATNIANVLVERAYVAAVDCYTAAIRITANIDGGTP